MGFYIEKVTQQMSQALTIFQSRKDQLCNDMSIVYGELLTTTKHRKAFAQSWISLGEKLRNLGVSQVPELQEKFDQLSELFGKVGNVHNNLAAAEERRAEDWRDVIERFAVVYRVNEEYVERKNEWKEAENKFTVVKSLYQIETTKPSFEKNKAKLEANLEAAKETKKKKLHAFKVKVAHLIKAKDDYNKFKVQRFRQGFTQYGEKFQQALQEELEILNQIKELLSGFTFGDEIAQEVAETLSGSVPPVDEQKGIDAMNADDIPIIPEEDEAYKE